eukprot:10843679-Lingulodinium_polyedra.AAC.1
MANQPLHSPNGLATGSSRNRRLDHSSTTFADRQERAIRLRITGYRGPARVIALEPAMNRKG